MEKVPPSKTKIYVRVVRCPRCARLLAEPTDVPLYGCGGCGTLLQAKHYKNEGEKRGSSDYSSDVQNDESKHNPQPYEEHSEHNIGIDQNIAQSGKLDQQPKVSSSAEEVSSSNQCEAQPQSASSSQDTNETSYSNALARLTIEDPSSSLEQKEIVVEEQFEDTDSSSQATTTTTLNRELDVQVLQNESCDDLDKEELQLVADLEEENTNRGLKYSDKIEETRDLHKSQTRKSSAYEGSASSYEAEYLISKDSKSEEYYKGWKNKHHFTKTQRTTPMLHVIEMPPQHTRHGPKRGSRAQLSYLYEPSGFITVDGKIFPGHPYYDSSQEICPNVFSESDCSQDHEMSGFHSRRKLLNARCIRPMVGAAPFVTCYKCLELLELPLEFLVLKTRRSRSCRVKCSTCLSNLEFAVVRRHLVPCILESRDQDERKSKMVEIQSHEEVKRSSLSLHKLMGYATPSAMFEDEQDAGREL